MDNVFFVAPYSHVLDALPYVRVIYSTEGQANQAAQTEAIRKHRPYFVFRVELYDGFSPKPHRKTANPTEPQT